MMRRDIQTKGLRFIFISYGSNARGLLASVATEKALDPGGRAPGTRAASAGHLLLAVGDRRYGLAGDRLAAVLLGLGRGAAFDGARLAGDLLLLFGDVGDGRSVQGGKRHLSSLVIGTPKIVGCSWLV